MWQSGADMAPWLRQLTYYEWTCVQFLLAATPASHWWHQYSRPCESLVTSLQPPLRVTGDISTATPVSHWWHHYSRPCESLVTSLQPPLWVTGDISTATPVSHWWHQYSRPCDSLVASVQPPLWVTGDISRGTSQYSFCASKKSRFIQNIGTFEPS